MKHGKHSNQKSTLQRLRSALGKGAHSKRLAVVYKVLVIALACAIVVFAGALVPVLNAKDSSTNYDSNLEDAVSGGFEASQVNSRKVPKPNALKAEELAELDFYLTQSQHGRCTAAAAAMMLRRAAYLAGDDDWADIDEGTIVDQAWSDGLLNKFTISGFCVRQHSFSSSGSARVSELRDLLEDHPEGIVIYDGNLPHAVLLTEYDSSKGVFYCADPASGYSGRRIAMSSTWNGVSRGGQDGVIANLTSYWAIG